MVAIIFQDFPSQIVHIAVNCVDQYLMRRKVQRSELQLLGITCMLIAARLVLFILVCFVYTLFKCVGIVIEGKSDLGIGI